MDAARDISSRTSLAHVSARTHGIRARDLHAPNSRADEIHTLKKFQKNVKID